MACGGGLSAVMSIAGAGMLPGASAIAGLGSSLGVNQTLTNVIGEYTSIPAISQFSDVVTAAAGLGGDALRTLGADVFPGLTNSLPSSFTSALAPLAPGGVFNGGFTGLIGQTAEGIMGQGDLGYFSQVFGQAQGYIGQANQLINSAQLTQGISNTFSPITGGMDSLITGSFSQVSEAFGAFGGDLSNLGNLIDMNNLPNLGDPSALVRQLASVGGVVPSVESALRSTGIDSLQLSLLGTGVPTDISASANKLLYENMTQITGSDLQQVKNVLGVTTPGINTMADLLDPVKILPNSFPTLTMPTPDGLRGIYATTAGAVNTNLERFLVDPNAPAYTGDDPIVRARLGLPAQQATT